MQITKRGTQLHCKQYFVNRKRGKTTDKSEKFNGCVEQYDYWDCVRKEGPFGIINPDERDLWFS